MNQRAPLPRELAIAPFDIRDALHVGVPKSRLRRSDLERPFRGVRASRPLPPGLLDRCYAYLARMPPDQIFSHVTAAHIHGIPLPYRVEQDTRVHVLVASGHRPPQMCGVVGHERLANEIDICLVHGLALTSPGLTWIHLATVLSIRELVIAGDYLISTTLERPAPLATIDQLRAAVAAGAGRRGIRRLRVAVECVRTGVESPKETETRLAIVDAGYPEPVPNRLIRDSAGNQKARVDLAYPRYLVALDYEGDVHRTNRKQFRKDITRREAVHDLGWRLIRLTDDDLADNARNLLARLDHNLRARGWRP